MATRGSSRSGGGPDLWWTGPPSPRNLGRPLSLSFTKFSFLYCLCVRERVEGDIRRVDSETPGNQQGFGVLFSLTPLSSCR